MKRIRIIAHWTLNEDGIFDVGAAQYVFFVLATTFWTKSLFEGKVSGRLQSTLIIYINTWTGLNSNGLRMNFSLN